MGLPIIDIIFKKLADTAIKRSQRGVVALILRDTKASINEYRHYEDIPSSTYSQANLDLIEKTFNGNPYKVIVVAVESTETIANALAKLDLKHFNYLAVPQMATGESITITSYIIINRAKGKNIKAVLANVNGDSEAIINFTTEGNAIGTKTYTALQYTCRIAGILAGISLKQSATYYVLEELTGITEKTNPNSSIDAGELILVNDGEKIKIGRAVNSLTTIRGEKTEQYKKIKIVEGMDLLKSDIRKVFEDYYVGKYTNSYDNKCLFFNYVVGYYVEMVKAGVLSAKGENSASVDLQSQMAYLIEKGVDVENMSEQQIKEADTDSTVFGRSSVRFIDAMEDLKFNIFM